jgi:hypothetical protein
MSEKNEKNTSKPITNSRYLLTQYRPVFNDIVLKDSPDYTSMNPEQMLNAYEKSLENLDLEHKIQMNGGQENYIRTLRLTREKIIDKIKSGEVDVYDGSEILRQIRKDIRSAELLIPMSEKRQRVMEMLSYCRDVHNKIEAEIVDGGKWWKR